LGGRLPLQFFEAHVLQETFFLDLPGLEVFLESCFFTILDSIRHSALDARDHHLIRSR